MPVECWVLGQNILCPSFPFICQDTYRQKLLNNLMRTHSRSGIRNSLIRWFSFVPCGIISISAQLFCCQSVQGITLAIQPASQNVPLGSHLTVDVSISGLGEAMPPSLGVFDFSLQFDPEFLAFDSISFGDASLGDQLGMVVGSILNFDTDPVAGLVNQFEVSLELPETLDTLQPASFGLTRMSFHAIKPGLSDLQIINVLLGDSLGLPIYPDQIVNGSVNVTVAPSIPDAGNSIYLLILACTTICYSRRYHPPWKSEKP